MAADSTTEFARNGIGWQVQLLQRRVGEWWELQRTRVELPEPPAASGEWAEAIARAVFWVTVALLAVWTLGQLWRLLAPFLRDLARASGVEAAASPSRSLSATRWRTRARAAAARGDYRLGVLCLYRAMLQQLEGKGIEGDPSRTDGEYWRLLRTRPAAASYQTLLVAHQQVCFGRADATRSLYDRCWQAFAELDES